jgi:hypothetical protein
VFILAVLELFELPFGAILFAPGAVVTGLAAPPLFEEPEPELLEDLLLELVFERVAIEGVALDPVALFVFGVIKVLPGIIICEGSAKATILPETNPNVNPTANIPFLMFDKRMNDISFCINFILLKVIYRYI